MTFRIRYLKDIVLARMDDNVLSLLGSLSAMSNVEIVSFIQENSAFLESLFTLWAEPDLTTEKRRDILLFLSELCTLSKSLQFTKRNAFFRFPRLNSNWIDQ
jgi:protein phosphatase-4 regulatory subunit 3